MEINFILYKSSGKFAYSGVTEIPSESNLWDEDILEVIDANQEEVIKGTITSRLYHCVVFAEDSGKFFNNLYLAEDE